MPSVMVLRWASRCLPGFSVLALMLLLVAAFPVTIHFPWRTGDLAAPKPMTTSHSEQHERLKFAQKIFIGYLLFVHLNMLAFSLRLSFSLLSLWHQAKSVLHRTRSDNYKRSHLVEHSIVTAKSDSISSESSEKTLLSMSTDFEPKHAAEDVLSSKSQLYSSVDSSDELIHAIILPNYREDFHTLFTTLSVLASHELAKSQYEVVLAMEEKEQEAPEKAKKLMSSFQNSFHAIRATFHPANLPGEIAGKSSNVAHAAREITNWYRHELREGNCGVVITVMDADTHLLQEYFLEIRRLHFAHADTAEFQLYCCPILFDRNSSESPVLVRCADILWAFAGISTLYPGTLISIPTSVYSLPIQLAEKVDGWDADPTAIGEDMHMMLKCYFKTGGSVITRAIHVPASQCNVSSDLRARGWRRTLDTCKNRYKQALRHMWGALDTGYAFRNSIPSPTFKTRRIQLWSLPRITHVALAHLLWEAHFLPCHLTIMLIFSVLHSIISQDNSHPTLMWAFWSCNLIRTLSFIVMNINLTLYDQWHQTWLRARQHDMAEANLRDCGFSSRCWWHVAQLMERVCFPVAGTIYGAVAMVHAVFSHFWTDRLVYRVSQKPSFANSELDRVSLA